MSSTSPVPWLGRLLQRLAASSVVFHYTRLPAYWGTFDRVRRVLDLREGESLLDVGCGTGLGAALTRGRYVGVDTDPALLRLARRVLPAQSHAVAAMSAVALGFRQKTFDKATLINVVHHLDEVTVDRLLAQLRCIVRQRVVILDAAPDTANRVSRFFLAHDRGRYVRPRHELRSLLARHYDIEAEETFHNTLRTVSQVLFTLTPRSPASLA